MRVLVAATSSQGGAGIAARRSYSALSESGIDATFVSLDYQESTEILRSGASIRFLVTLIRKTLTVLQSKYLQKSPKLMTPVSFNSFKWLYKIPKNEFQILHLHAFYNFISIEEIRQLCLKFNRVVITMHDERFFTGGCHYAGDCIGFTFECSKCPLTNSLFKGIPERALHVSIKTLRDIDNLEIISPSNWLASRARISKVLGSRDIHVIPNPIPSIFFKKRSARRIFPDKLIIGFNAYSLDNPYKGFTTLVKALELLDERDRQRINLRIATQSSTIPEINGIKFELDSPSNDVELETFYSQIDVLIIPSLEDNSPSVLGEALVSGASIVGSNVGGIPELLEKFNQSVFNPGDAGQLAKLISRILNEGTPQNNILDASSVFSNETYVAKVLEIYKG